LSGPSHLTSRTSFAAFEHSASQSIGSHSMN
jgi:hypothetical protein